MGNEQQYCLCFNQPQQGNEKNLSNFTHTMNNPIIQNIDYKDTENKSFVSLFEKKLPEIGQYSSVNDLTSQISNKTKTHLADNPLDISKYSTNSKIFEMKPIHFNNGNIYYGNWNEMIQMEGYGKMLLSKEGILAEGLWKEGQLVKGRIYFPNDDIYEGDVKNSTFEGHGTLYFSDGVIYKGEFVCGERSGKGQQIYPDHSIYNGQFKNDLFNGEGEFTWSNGVTYKGMFVDSQLCGKGKLMCSKLNSCYEGMFKENKFHGKGKYIWGNTQNVYEGQYENGIKQGKGVYVKNKKFVFDGMFNNGKPHGYGEISIGNVKYKCIWRYGQSAELPTILEGNEQQQQQQYDSSNNNINEMINFQVEQEDIDVKMLNFLNNSDSNYIESNSVIEAGQFLPTEQFTE